jgi:hypothetical protein
VGTIELTADDLAGSCAEHAAPGELFVEIVGTCRWYFIRIEAGTEPPLRGAVSSGNDAVPVPQPLVPAEPGARGAGVSNEAGTTGEQSERKTVGPVGECPPAIQRSMLTWIDVTVAATLRWLEGQVESLRAETAHVPRRLQIDPDEFDDLDDVDDLDDEFDDDDEPELESAMPVIAG